MVQFCLQQAGKITFLCSLILLQRYDASSLYSVGKKLILSEFLVTFFQ